MIPRQTPSPTIGMQHVMGGTPAAASPPRHLPPMDTPEQSSVGGDGRGSPMATASVLVDGVQLTGMSDMTPAIPHFEPWGRVT